MNDNDIRKLFEEFKPEPHTPDFVFMNRLKRNMAAVEMVKKKNLASRRRSRIAIVLSGISGFLSGVVMTTFMPRLSDWIRNIRISIPFVDMPDVTIDGQTAGWIVLSIVSVFIALNTYDVVMARLNVKEA